MEDYSDQYNYEYNEHSEAEDARGEAADLSQKATRPEEAEGSIMQALLREAAKYKQLTPEEEKQLALRVQAGDAEAKEIFVNSNIKLALAIATKKYAGFQVYGKNYLSICIDDIIQNAMLGLVKAVDKFDPEMNTKFSTMATIWIRKEIDRGLHEDMRPVKVPEQYEEMFATISGIRREISAQNSGDLPSDAELAPIIADRLGITQEKALEVLALEDQVSGAISLNAQIDDGEGDSGSVGDTISNEEAADPAEGENRKIADAILATLDPIEQHIINMSFGINGEGKMAMKDIALELYNRGFTSRRGVQMSGEAVRLKKEAAIEKMQKIYEKHYKKIVDI